MKNELPESDNSVNREKKTVDIQHSHEDRAKKSRAACIGEMCLRKRLYPVWYGDFSVSFTRGLTLQDNNDHTDFFLHSHIQELPFSICSDKEGICIFFSP